MKNPSLAGFENRPSSSFEDIVTRTLPILMAGLTPYGKLHFGISPILYEFSKEELILIFGEFKKLGDQLIQIAKETHDDDTPEEILSSN